MAKPGDTVDVSVTNVDGETMTTQLALSALQVATQQASDVDVTGFAVSTSTLALSGKVSNVADLPITSGLTGTAKIGDVSVPVSFESDGSYSATFVSFAGSVAKVGDAVDVSVTNVDGDTVSFQVVLSAEQVIEPVAETDVETGFAVSTEEFTVTGQVTNELTQVITSGLTGTAKIGDVSAPIIFDAEGSYTVSLSATSGSVAQACLLYTSDAADE